MSERVRNILFVLFVLCFFVGFIGDMRREHAQPPNIFFFLGVMGWLGVVYFDKFERAVLWVIARFKSPKDAPVVDDETAS